MKNRPFLNRGKWLPVALAFSFLPSTASSQAFDDLATAFTFVARQAQKQAILLLDIPPIPAPPQEKKPQEEKGSGKGAQPKKTKLKIGIMGASVSAGYRLDKTFLEYIETASSGTVVGSGLPSSTFMMNPFGEARKQIALFDSPAEAKDKVLALDFLFWFVYGKKTDSRRETDLRAALKLLEGVKSPLYLGTIPYLPAQGSWLEPSWVPSPAKIRAFNSIIETWASGRTSVTVVPFGEWVKKFRDGQPLKYEGKDRIFTKEQLFQSDGLHPNDLGAKVLSAQVLRVLKE